MKNNELKSNFDVGIKSIVLEVINHALIPLILFPMAFFVVPVFAEKADELNFKVDKLTLLVFKVSSFICSYWYVCVLILILLLVIDAVVLLSLKRMSRIAAYCWWGLVVLVEGGIAGFLVVILVRLQHSLSTVPWLCPV